MTARSRFSALLRDHPRSSLASVILVGAVLRLWGLGEQSLWLDEASTWFFATQKDLSSIIFSEPVHPPLHKLLVAGWIAIVGESEAALRLLPALFGVLTMWVAHALGVEALALQRARGQDTSGTLERWPLLCAAMIAFNPYLISISQELRMYSLVGLLATATFWVLARWLRWGKHRDGVALIFLGIAGVYTHYFYAFSLLGAAATLAFFRWDIGQELPPDARPPARRVLIAFLLGGALIVLAFLPWMLHVIENFQSVSRYKTTVIWALLYVWMRYLLGFAMVVLDAVRLRDGHLASVHWLEWTITALTLLTTLALVFAGARRARGKDVLLKLFAGGVVIATAAPLLIVHPFTGLFRPYYVVGVAPLWLMLLGLGLLSLEGTRRRVAVGALVTITVLGLLPHYGSPGQIGPLELRWGKENWRGAVETINANASPGSAVLYAPGYLSIPFGYYERGERPHVGMPDEIPDPEVHLEAALEALGQPDEVWLLISHRWYDDTYIDTLKAFGWSCFFARDYLMQWGLRVRGFRRVEGDAQACPAPS